MKGKLLFAVLVLLMGTGYVAVKVADKSKEEPKVIPATVGCKKEFGTKEGIGCLKNSDCVDVSSITPHHDCLDSSKGFCYASKTAMGSAQKLINSFNEISNKKCELKVSSALQVDKIYSRSTCHHPGNKISGTCMDFNVIPATDTCFGYFYKAAESSGVVESYTNEYKTACHEATQTGGNIHTNFGTVPKKEEEKKIIEPFKPCDEDCTFKCVKSVPGTFGVSVNVPDKECVDTCIARVKACKGEENFKIPVQQ